MKICVVSLATKEIEDMSISILNKQFYCNKYNYTFVNYNERLSKRHCPWDKILCILKTISWFDYVVWIDADAIFNNLSVRLEDIINEHSDKDLLICKDPCYNEERLHCMMNTGVMIFKNTLTSIELLHETWNSCSDYSIESLDKYSYDGYPHEQGALIDRLKTEKYSNCYYLYEQTKFNTHPNISNKETFIIHFMGSRQNDFHRNEFINRIEKINKNNNINETNIYYTLNKKNKFTLTTMYTDNIKSYGEISTKNKEWYASKYNIELIVTKERLSQRHPAWDKIQCVLNAMMQNNSDYIIWMDADAIFLTDQIDFNTIVNIYPNKNFIVCNDPYNPHELLDISHDYNKLENLHIINTGVFIIKNNAEMKELLVKTWNTQTNTNKGIYNINKVVSLETCIHNWDDWPYEQGALHTIFAGRTDIVILPQKAFNTLPCNSHNHSFILHDMGGRMNQDNMIQQFINWNNKLNIQ